ncbi:membrane bound O-acyl transferase family-domain-containing protein [Apiospora sp. TS-2023a]
MAGHPRGTNWSSYTTLYLAFLISALDAAARRCLRRRRRRRLLRLLCVAGLCYYVRKRRRLVLEGPGAAVHGA